MKTRQGKSAFTLIELLVVVTICGVLIGLLLPAVQNARERSRQSRLYTGNTPEDQVAKSFQEETAPALPAAIIKSFQADIQLTPRLSVGTAAAESIYEAEIAGQMSA